MGPLHEAMTLVVERGGPQRKGTGRGLGAVHPGHGYEGGGVCPALSLLAVHIQPEPYWGSGKQGGGLKVKGGRCTR